MIPSGPILPPALKLLDPYDTPSSKVIIRYKTFNFSKLSNAWLNLPLMSVPVLVSKGTAHNLALKILRQFLYEIHRSRFFVGSDLRLA
jgi:hypothetical protein